MRVYNGNEGDGMKIKTLRDPFGTKRKDLIQDLFRILLLDKIKIHCLIFIPFFENWKLPLVHSMSIDDNHTLLSLTEDLGQPDNGEGP